jgi:hypothetical protein
MPHLRNRANSFAECVPVDFQDHNGMVIPAFVKLLIGTTELSDTFDAFIIVSSTWEPDYASHPQVLYFDVWPWVLIV